MARTSHPPLGHTAKHSSIKVTLRKKQAASSLDDVVLQMIFQNNKRITLAEEGERAREFKIISFELFLDIVSSPPGIMSVLSYDWPVIYQRGLK